MDRDLKKYVTAVRRRLHMRPELGGEEYGTQKFIVSELRGFGFQVKKLAGTGVTGFLKKGSGCGVVAVRADMDALPVREETGKPYASIYSNRMHACGHDGNMAIVLGALRELSSGRCKFDGTVKALFQPNEEGSRGAESMIRAGALLKPRPDVIYGVHVNPMLPPGVLGIKPGPFMASVDEITVTLRGPGGHAAMPHVSSDLISAASRLVGFVNEAVARKISAHSPCIVSFCMIRAGERFNVLPSVLTVTGTVRTLDESVRRKVCGIINGYLQSLQLSDGIKGVLSVTNLGNVLQNDPAETEFVSSAAARCFGGRALKTMSKPSMGGEDFAQYLKQIKGCFFYFGTGSGAGTGFGWHSSRFDIDESGLEFGAVALARIVSERLLLFSGR